MQTFDVTYQLKMSKEETVDEKIEGICLEQSVELPRSVLSKEIASQMVGECISCESLSENIFNVRIAWPVDNIGEEVTQFLNILYGNISLKPGIKIINVDWNSLPKGLFPGPAFGIDNIRALFDIHERPFSATALKPMGSSPGQLAAMCYQFARGGLDIIKDDHGLTNQSYAPFDERLSSCIQAVKRAEDETGHRTRYFPNITAGGTAIFRRMERAVQRGADGVLICPHLTGLATLSQLRSAYFGIPVIAHPAFSGAFVRQDDEGFSPDVLYGQLWRALGADFIIYPNTGGRFSFSVDQCKQINQSARTETLPFKRSFPMPGGGLKRENIKQWKNAYGPDTVFLIGSSLYKDDRGLEEVSREFRNVLMES